LDAKELARQEDKEAEDSNNQNIDTRLCQ